VELQFRGKVGGVGFVRGVKVADVLLSFVDPNACVPALDALVPRHAKQARGASATRSCLILHIHGSRHVTQVCYSIVGLVAVEVVNVMRGHYAMRVQPCQAMRLEERSVDPDDNVAIAVDRSRDSAYLDPLATYSPPKDSAVQLVVKQRSQRFGGKVSAFHFRLFRLRMAAAFT
jgi:hypothetical protein